jgi:starch phosphorylase
MANLAIVGSSHVNGVAGIHTEILRSRVFLPFAQLFPDKFLNITNGVTQVRIA